MHVGVSFFFFGRPGLPFGGFGCLFGFVCAFDAPPPPRPRRDDASASRARRTRSMAPESDAEWGTTAPSAPLWERKLTGPGLGKTSAKVALSDSAGSVLSTPRQRLAFNPKRRL